MKLIEEGNLLIIIERPYLRWILAVLVILLFSFIMLRGFMAEGLRAPLSGWEVFLASLLFIGIASSFLLRFPAIRIEIDLYSATFSIRKIWLLGQKEDVLLLKEVKSFEIQSRFSYFGFEDQEKYRIEARLRNGKSLPLTSRWWLLRSRCEKILDKLNSQIPKLNRRKKEKPESWKEDTDP